MKMHKITVERLINAPREDVFAAFSTAQALTKWYTPSPDISVNILVFEFKVGSPYRFQYKMADGLQPILCGKYDIINSPEEIGFTWMWEAPDEHADIPTRVRINLQGCNGATKLILTHEQLPSREIGQRHAIGWKNTLNQLNLALTEGDLPIKL